jgi:hypothetical protein
MDFLFYDYPIVPEDSHPFDLGSRFIMLSLLLSA